MRHLSTVAPLTWLYRGTDSPTRLVSARLRLSQDASAVVMEAGEAAQLRNVINSTRFLEWFECYWGILKLTLVLGKDVMPMLGTT